MSLQTNLILIVVLAVLVVPGAKFITWYRRINGTEEGRREKRMLYYKAYVFLYNNVFTRKRFRHIVVSMSSLMCYDLEGLRENAVMLFAKSAGVAVLLPVAGLIIFQNIPLGLLMVLVGYVYYDVSVDKTIDKQVRAMTEELVFVIQSISDTYSVTESIPQAVINCERGAYMEKPVQRIYEIVTDEDGYEMLAEFKRQTPIRLLGALATTCYICNEEGDVRDASGSSSFKDAMTNLRRETDMNVRDLTKTAIAFKSLGIIALVGVFCVPIIDLFFTTQMPGTSVFINGMYGLIVKSAIIIITIVTYYVIGNCMRPSVVNEVDKSEIIDNVSRDPRVKRFVEKLKPKSYKTQVKLQKQLNGALSSKDENYIYTMKILVSAALLVSSFILIVVFTWFAKYSLFHNYGTMTLMSTSTELTETQLEQIKDIDKQYITASEQMSTEEITALLKANVKGITDMQIEDQIDRLSQKRTKYQSIGFKWWYVVLAYLFGVIGWFSPEISLMFRKTLVQFEASQDVMQLQTIMLVLASTKMDVFKVLQWLMSESTIHKAPLRYAMIDYSTDPEEALNRLESTVQNKDLKRIVIKLKKAVESLSISEAFRDIALDKQQSLTINELMLDQAREYKRNMANTLSMLPMMLAIFAEGIGPMMILGIQQVMTAFTEMGAL